VINWKNIIKIMSDTTYLISALLMALGEQLIGINHISIATSVGITGLDIITTANRISFRSEKGAK
jgi:hypothetical protein